MSTDSNSEQTDESEANTESTVGSGNTTRRGALATLAGLGVLGLSSGTASAVDDHDHLGDTWSGNSPTDHGLRVDAGNTRFGIFGTTSSDNGWALLGRATASSGSTIGMFGRSDSTEGTGVYGIASADSGDTYGVRGRSDSPTGDGVYGQASSPTGVAVGVRGQSRSPQGFGLWGVGRDGADGLYGRAYGGGPDGNATGVLARSDAPEGRGVVGFTTSSSGVNTGVYGRSESSEGTGVRGWAMSSSGETVGVLGQAESEDDGSAGVRGHAMATDVNAETTGVEGISDADADNSSSPEVIPAGVHGKTTGDGSTHGVRGETDSYNGRGVMGFTTSETYEHDTFTTTGAAVMGVTDLSNDDDGITEAIGVVGNSVAQEGESFGVLGRNESPDGAAVIGNSVHNDGTAVFANGDSYTSGDHTVTGDTEVGGRLQAMDVMTGEVLADMVSVSTDDDSAETAAIYGEATDTTSENYGVVGTTASANSDASGVLGIAEATGGSIYPTGVKGVAEDGIAMHALHNATDGFSVGLFALTHSDSGQAIQANASADSGETSGVYGRSGSPDGHGVRGKGEGSSGPSIGVLGQTESPEGYGVYSEADTRSDGLIEAGDGVVHEQRGEPSTDELASGDVMTYNSDGTDGHSIGDLVYAINDGGSILTQVIAEKSNAS